MIFMIFPVTSLFFVFKFFQIIFMISFMTSAIFMDRMCHHSFRMNRMSNDVIAMLCRYYRSSDCPLLAQCCCRKSITSFRSPASLCYWFSKLVWTRRVEILTVFKNVSDFIQILHLAYYRDRLLDFFGLYLNLDLLVYTR